MKNKIKYSIISALFLPVITFAQTFKIKNPLTGINSLEKLLDVFVQAIVKLGSVVVVFMIIYSGFLFVKAQGNDSELTAAKNTFMWTVIGAVVLLGARAIAAMVQGTAAQLGV